MLPSHIIHFSRTKQIHSSFLPDTAYLTGFSPWDNLYRCNYICSVSHGVNVDNDFPNNSIKVELFHYIALNSPISTIIFSPEGSKFLKKDEKARIQETLIFIIDYLLLIISSWLFVPFVVNPNQRSFQTGFTRFTQIFIFFFSPCLSLLIYAIGILSTLSWFT